MSKRVVPDHFASFKIYMRSNPHKPTINPQLEVCHAWFITGVSTFPKEHPNCVARPASLGPGTNGPLDQLTPQFKAETIHFAICWFPEIGLPAGIIHWNGIFPNKPSSYRGTPHGHGTPHTPRWNAPSPSQPWLLSRQTFLANLGVSFQGCQKYHHRVSLCWIYLHKKKT